MLFRTMMLGLLTLLLTGCGQSGEEVAVIRTSLGDIAVAFHKDAPGHVQNFKKLTKEGFYDGTTFHRVIPGFMIQGGDPNSKDDNRENDGTGSPGYTIPAEIKHQHVRGALAAARLPDQFNKERASSGSQFFICLDPQPSLDGGYTVFGYVVEGMEVVQQIALVKRDQKDNPVQKVLIRSVTLEHRKLAGGES